MSDKSLHSTIVKFKDIQNICDKIIKNPPNRPMMKEAYETVSLWVAWILFDLEIVEFWRDTPTCANPAIDGYEKLYPHNQQ